MHQEGWMFMGWMWLFWILLAAVVTLLFVKVLGVTTPERREDAPEEISKHRPEK